jgi:LCP family protein required for cell wall assembly
VLGCFVVLLASAATSAAALFGQIDQFQAALNEHRSVRLKDGVLAATSFGGPQTLLLVGNDQRTHTTTQPVLPHSNEMLLVRFNPGTPWISMLSIPRELLTTIDCPRGGAVTTRLNYALTCGGFTTLIKTIKQITGLGVNHVVSIDFDNFKKAVNEMGCVYATIDRRYLHVNTATSQQYTAVNLEPGYQRLCGAQALQFVSYRHGDTSLIRDARDQTFLLSAKAQYGPTLLDNESKFEKIFGHLVQTDASLKSTVGIEDLLLTLIQSAGKPVRQVQVPVDLASTDPAAVSCSCVTLAYPTALTAAAHSFLYGGAVPSKSKTQFLAEHLAVLATQKTKTHKHAKRSGSAASHIAASLALAPTTDLLAGARAAQTKLTFPLEFPHVQIAYGVGAGGYEIHRYRLKAPGGRSAFPAYAIVFPVGLLGQYYDVQGTTWRTAPGFDSPQQVVSSGGTSYYLWYQGQHLEQVAWYEHGAVYWDHNSLNQAVTNGQMLAIAEQTAPVTGAVPQARRRVRLRVGKAPSRILGIASDAEGLNELGWIGGLLALLLLPLALYGLWLGRRDVISLRGRARAAVLRAGELEAHLATALRPGGARVAMAGLGRLEPLPLGPTASDRARERAAARASGAYSGTSRSNYRATQVQRRWLLAGGVVFIAVLLGVYALTRSSPSTTVVHHHHHASNKVTANVAVLNGGSVSGAAAQLGKELKGDHVHVGTVANLGSAPPIGMTVLYSQGFQRQARLVARLLASQSPTVSPIDPAAQAAAGAGASVVVVIP